MYLKTETVVWWRFPLIVNDAVTCSKSCYSSSAKSLQHCPHCWSKESLSHWEAPLGKFVLSKILRKWLKKMYFTSWGEQAKSPRSALAVQLPSSNLLTPHNSIMRNCLPTASGYRQTFGLLTTAPDEDITIPSYLLSHICWRLSSPQLCWRKKSCEHALIWFVQNQPI